jgi:hypothetical protein
MHVMRNWLTGMLAVLLLVGCPVASSRGDHHMGGSEADWRKAEQVVRDYFVRLDGSAPTSIERRSPHLRYLFDVRTAKRRWPFILVHEGQILTPQGGSPEQAPPLPSPGLQGPPPSPLEVAPEKKRRYPDGIERLGAYLKKMALLRQREMTAEELGEIADFFDALPDEPKVASTSYYSGMTGGFADVNPKLEWRTDGARFILHYRPDTTHPGRTEGPTPAGIDTFDLAHWTLTIPPDYRLTWERALVPHKKGQ